VRLLPIWLIHSSQPSPFLRSVFEKRPA
jgi:hypothetical protein